MSKNLNPRNITIFTNIVSKKNFFVSLIDIYFQYYTTFSNKGQIVLVEACFTWQKMRLLCYDKEVLLYV